MARTLTLSFLIGLTIQAFITGILGKLEIITISSGQQNSAASMLAIFAALFLLATVITDQKTFLLQVVEFSGMTIQALLSSILINAGVQEFATYQFQLNLALAYLVIALALAWEWRGQLRI